MSLDFWPLAAITGLVLTFLGVVLGGVGLWASARQIKAITGQIGTTTHLIAAGQERTATLVAGAEERTQRILDRMDARAEEEAGDA